MSSSTDWNAFFLKAGIPSRYAAKYAVIFNDHRIQDDMLKDLSKEILYDMGIKTMGDVIAIMRHANDVEEEKSRNRILSARPHSSEAAIKKPVKRVVVEEKADAAATISTSLSRRLGPTHAVPAAPAVRNVSLPVREPIIKRVISVPAASERVIRLPAVSSGSVFDRLGGTAGESETTSTVTSGSVLRGMALTASSMPTAAKATATVRPTRGTPYSVKDRLGAGSRGVAGVREVVSSNLKMKSDPPLSARLHTVPIKKSIFDRLGA